MSHHSWQWASASLQTTENPPTSYESIVTTVSLRKPFSSYTHPAKLTVAPAPLPLWHGLSWCVDTSGDPRRWGGYVLPKDMMVNTAAL